MSYRNRDSVHQWIWTLTLALLCGGAAQALPEDRNQPVRINADSAVQENTTVTYRGKVIITQGSLRVDADQVVVYHANGKVQKIVATGKPAHFQQQPEVNGGMIKATATTLVYYQGENRFELLQDAYVERDGSSVKGNRIEYLPSTQTVRAQGSVDSSPGRVEMVLPPEPPPAPPANPASSPADSTGEH